MVKQVFLPILAVVAFIVIVGIFSQKSGFFRLTNMIGAQLTPTLQKTVTIGTKTINVQVADTEENREKGLSGVTSLDANGGMLFIFNSQNVSPVFWMKGMLIPLDFIWIKDGRIIRIDKNVPKPAENTPDNKLKMYSAGQPVDYVLEVNAGFSDSNSIKVKDVVSISGI